ncbi:MAG: RNA polymerase factor sigma-54 [Bacteroidota bacterium]
MQTLSQHHQLLQKLTPQQVQYLKMLQLPIFALEQRIKEELEQNPLLDEGEELEQVDQDNEKVETEAEAADQTEVAAEKVKEEDKYTIDDFMNDDLSGYKTPRFSPDDEDREEMPLADQLTMNQHLIEQLGLLNLTPDEELLGKEIIGNIDEDGYLRRDIALIVQDLNLEQDLQISNELADCVLTKIQRLDPAGIGSRNLRECLIAQLETGDQPEDLKTLALLILREHWDLFSMKHYEELAKEAGIDHNRLKVAIELIQKLNPKPGEGDFTPQQNYVIPDFIVERDGEDFLVQLNERNIPPLRINKRYKDIMSRRKANGTPNEVKDFIRKQFDAAKWFISSIHQRRDTMLRVMNTILELQREFFETGENLKPMIYKDIAEIIGMDISTISRVVNGKYVQTEYGVFELRYFFSDSIRTTAGEEISNKEVKKTIKDIIDRENPDRPYSDDRIAEMLRADGLNIARRTIAKYREAMKIPVARLRRKI